MPDEQKNGGQQPEAGDEKTSKKSEDGEKTSNKSEESIHPNRYYHVKDKLDEAQKKIEEYEKKLGVDNKKDDKNKNQDDSSNLSEDILEQKLNKVLEKRKLKEMNLPEEIEEKTKKYAQLEGLSVEEAANSDYIQHLKREHDRKKRLEEASPSSGKSGKSGKTTSTSNYDPSKPRDPANYNLDTKEGRERWQADGKRRQKWIQRNK